MAARTATITRVDMYCTRCASKQPTLVAPPHHGLVAPDEPVAVQHDLTEVVERAPAGGLAVEPDRPPEKLGGGPIPGIDGSAETAISIGVL